MSRGAGAPRAPSLSGVPNTIDAVVFLGLLCLLCIRPMMYETFERVEWSFIPLGPSGPTPATTAVLDFLLVTCSAVALSRHPPLSHLAQCFAVALACLIAAAIASSAVADQRRLAVNASSSLIIGVMACAALARLCTARWMTSAIVAACLASGVVNAWKCVAQTTREFGETRVYWEEYEKELVRRNVDVRVPEIVNYKRRLESGEAFGYLSHSNIAGECLASWLLASSGLLGALVSAARGAARRGIPAAGIAAAVATISLGVGLVLTHARGAIASAAAGLFGVIFIGAIRRRPTRRPALILASFAVLYVGCITAFGAWGVARGSMPDSSLAFRWHYWTAAVRGWLDAPLTGVGGENFLSVFLRYKPVENPEDVRNPHNLWVWLLVEYGPVGLLSVAAMFWFWAHAALRRLASKDVSVAAELRNARPLPIVLIGPIVAVPMALAFFGRPELLFAGAEASLLDRLYVWGVEVVLVWVASYLCLFWTAMHALEAVNRATPRCAAETAAATTRGTCFCSGRDGDEIARVDLRARASDIWLRAGLIASVGVALVHNLVGFSLSTPAGVAVIGMLAAAAISGFTVEGGASTVESSGARSSRDFTNRELKGQSPVHARAPLPLIALSMAVIAHLFLVVIPTWRTGSALSEMRRSLAAARSPQQAGDAVLLAEQAIDADPWDSTPAREAARTSRQIASSPGIPIDDRIRWLRRAQSNARIAIARSPASVAGHRMSGAILVDLGMALFGQSGVGAVEGVATLRAAAADWDEAARLNPTHAGTRIEAGKAWFLVWQRSDDRDAGRASAIRFRDALRLDEKRPDEEIVRLSSREKNEIQAHLAQLSAAGLEDP